MLKTWSVQDPEEQFNSIPHGDSLVIDLSWLSINHRNVGLGFEKKMEYLEKGEESLCRIWNRDEGVGSGNGKNGRRRGWNEFQFKEPRMAC